MLKYLTIFVGVLLGSGCFAQTTDPNLFYREQIQINQDGMKVLGGWAAANMIASGIATGQTQGSSKYFHQMNIYWNIVNGGLVALSVLQANKQLQHLPDNWEANRALQKKVEKLFLINSGLDLVYIGTGAYLLNRSTSTSSEMLKGYGQSLILQGGFLFLFDGAMYLLHHKHGLKHSKLLNQIAFDGQRISVRWVF
ncbi:hypothetical protein QM480_12995 [Flectobacillus sp. DC10W]|uniref:Uncharacterized protein n=1 Tax=Flectobacillus longus TaxID=2984207 RepID=A0ABT6YNS8_9BACT|nr:hypothetical protein [Flectobacillus longus]MDI9865249.1 hypothetical protein [Flectobacillus longus]